uniref:Uncharacterized protein n=1 Tax=Rhizophora mucronata TaxID=61149 RepID=A0A2P2N605_RHIMU
MLSYWLIIYLTGKDVRHLSTIVETISSPSFLDLHVMCSIPSG